MMGLRKKGGFSLIEAILAVVVLAACFFGLTYVLSNTTTQNIDIDISTTAVLLAREKMAETKAKNFADIVDVASTNFGGNFTDFNYEVATEYVNSTGLDLPVAGPTDYKRIVVTVTGLEWPGSISLCDLKTNTE